MTDNPDPIEFQKYLRGVDYPIGKDELIDIARDNGAPDDLLDRLASSGTEDFESPTDVSSAISGG